MRRTPHLLRDAVLLTLPVLGVVVWLWISALGSLWNAEVRNFHGELVRDLRVGTLRTMVRAAIRNVFVRRERHYLPLKRPGSSLTPEPKAEVESIEVYDLRMRGDAIDALAADLPESARSRQEGLLAVGGGTAQEIEASWRGQRMENYFFPQKAWKLRTKKEELVDRQRLLNLTPIEDRMASFSTFTLARGCGLPAPRTKFVHLYVNLESAGIYLQEEQLDESFLQRTGKLPGDVFYGEVFVPDVPASSSWELFWNPYLWEKHDRWDRYADEWRPWLSELLDATADRSLAGFDRLQQCLDESFALYYAVLCYEGDQHVDASHNVRLALDVLSGRFIGLLWNPLSNMPEGQGVETTANPLFRRLAQDPRFLDRVAGLVSERMIATPEPTLQLDALDRLERGLAEADVAQEPRNLFAVRSTRRRLLVRHATVRKQHEVAEVAFEQADVAPAGTRLTLSATSAASLRLRAIAFDPATDASRLAELALFEDRDFDGVLGPGDPAVAAHLDGHRLVVDDPDERLPVGRDFTASYQQAESQADDAFQQHREFTRLAALATTFLLRGRAGPLPRVVTIDAVRTVGAGAVSVYEGAPHGLVATESIHPWRIPPPPPPRHLQFSGTVELRESLVIGERDRLEVAPGTQLRLAPGVSLQVKSAVHWRDVAITRLERERPFGVVALQGHGCDGSALDGVTIEGGSETTLGFIHYSGMFSAHQVDRLAIRDSRFAANLLGDDAVHLGACRELLLERNRVENANADAIDLEFCDGVVRDATIVAPGNDGIDMMTCRLLVERVEVVGAGDKGLSIGQSSTPEVVGCTLRDCVIGIGIQEASEPIVRDTRIEGCRTGLSARGSLGRFERCTFAGNRADVRLDDPPLVSFERCDTDQKAKLPGKQSGGGPP